MTDASPRETHLEKQAGRETERARPGPKSDRGKCHSNSAACLQHITSYNVLHFESNLPNTASTCVSGKHIPV